MKRAIILALLLLSVAARAAQVIEGSIYIDFEDGSDESTGDGLQLASANNATVANRPKLTVRYTTQ